MAIIKRAKNIIIHTTNKEINLGKKFEEISDEKYLEATNGNIMLNSVKKVMKNGNA
jgi:hypothetical protein